MFQRWLPIFSTTVAMGMAPACFAAIVPNPGTAAVVTSSSSATATYVTDQMTQQADAFETTITATLNGGTVYDTTFALPFSDPNVQSAVAAVDFMLGRDGATYGTPILASSATTFGSSVMQGPTPNLTCSQLSSGSYARNSNATVTTATTYGPGTINVGDCHADTFNILAGQVDFNVNTDLGYDVPVDAITTITRLTTQLYQITGFTATTPPSTSVPEPATAGLLFAGLAVLRGIRRRR